MTAKLFGWDEVSNEVIEYGDPDDLRALNQEGGWEYDGLLPNGVAVLRTDRHSALETWAPNIEDAKTKFRIFEAYRESEICKNMR